MTTPGATPLAGREHDFYAVCSSAREALGEAIDLLLLHNERQVRGNQPRKSLNPVTVLLAVAAWERFVVDIRALSGQSRSSWQGPGFDRQIGGVAELAKAAPVLNVASAGRLPEAWRIQVFQGWRGKTPTHAATVRGATNPGLHQDQLAAAVLDYIKLRHSVAHRAYPQHAYTGSWWDGDAVGDTVQAGAARGALAVFLQLIQQSIQAITAALIANGSLVDRDAVALPTWWFRTDPPAGVRGVASPGRLWGTTDLIALSAEELTAL